MNAVKKRNEMTMKEVVYAIPGMKEITVERDIGYKVTNTDTLTLDLYRPPGLEPGARRPAVLFVIGYPDPGFEAMVGCKLKEMAGYISWGQLVATSGLVAVTYTNHDPISDVSAVLDYLHQNAASLGIDEHRLGVWACSGNVPTALSLLMSQSSIRFKAAALCYGPMLDVAGSTCIANAAASLGFANPTAGKSIDDVTAELPLVIVRAGKETMPGLNESIDNFFAAATARNLPVTFVNHATGPHSFDLIDDTEVSREMVRRILSFLRFHLFA